MEQSPSQPESRNPSRDSRVLHGDAPAGRCGTERMVETAGSAGASAGWRDVLPVAGTATLGPDGRVLAAAHRDLEKLRAEGRFRDDLFYRLNVFPIHVPPLRARKEDIAPLLDHFVAKYSRRMGKRFAHIDR